MTLFIGGMLIGIIAVTVENKANIDSLKSEFRAFKDAMNDTTDSNKGLQDIVENIALVQHAISCINCVNIGKEQVACKHVE